MLTDKAVETPFNGVCGPVKVTMLARFDSLRSDKPNVLLLSPDPLEQWICQDKEIPAAIVDSQGREMLIPPLGEVDIHDALAIRKATLTTPPEDGSRRNGAGSESEHLVLAPL